LLAEHPARSSGRARTEIFCIFTNLILLDCKDSVKRRKYKIFSTFYFVLSAFYATFASIKD
jgi:hypothetical protein